MSALIGIVSLVAGCSDDAADDSALAPGSSAPASTLSSAVVNALRVRRVELPSLVDGHPCPASTVWSTPSADLGPLAGDGPARAALGNIDGAATLTIAPAANFGSAEWGGNKVLWALDITTSGPVLIRGHQLDGPNKLRFNEGADPSLELVLNPVDRTAALDGGWIDFPASMRVRAAGCYGAQIDTESGTTTLIFEAVPQAGPDPDPSPPSE